MSKRRGCVVRSCCCYRCWVRFLCCVRRRRFPVCTHTAITTPTTPTHGRTKPPGTHALAREMRDTNNARTRRVQRNTHSRIQRRTPCNGLFFVINHILLTQRICIIYMCVCICSFVSPAVCLQCTFCYTFMLFIHSLSLCRCSCTYTYSLCSIVSIYVYSCFLVGSIFFLVCCVLGAF